MEIFSNQSKVIYKEPEFLEHNVMLNHKSYLMLVPSSYLMVCCDCLVLQTSGSFMECWEWNSGELLGCGFV